ncbi:MAG TPA: DUF2752 domain-containing protein [Terrimicrobium sp.]
MPSSRKAMTGPPLRLDQRKSRASAAAIIVAALVGAALLPLGAPPEFPGLPRCLLKGATGLPCPFCGGTRAAQALLRGDLSRSLYFNVAALPAVLAFVTAALVLGWEAMRGRALGDWDALMRRVRTLLPILAALLCAYWLVHLGSALRSRKSELVDLRNPIAHAVHERFLGRAE